MIQFTLFRSQANLSPDDPGNLKIMAQSLRNNSSVGLTGLLFREKDYFFHYIEGEQTALLKLYILLAQDTRHTALTRLSTGTSAKRRLSNWSMVYSKGAGDSLVPSLFDRTSGAALGEIWPDTLAAHLFETSCNMDNVKPDMTQRDADIAKARGTALATLWKQATA